MEAQTFSNLPEVENVDINDLAGVSKEERLGIFCDEDGNPVRLTYDQLVADLISQYEETIAEYRKLTEALDNLSYSSTVTRVSLEGMQEKKDKLNKLQGAIEALYLYSIHVDPNVTDKEFTFAE